MNEHAPDEMPEDMPAEMPEGMSDDVLIRRLRSALDEVADSNQRLPVARNGVTREHRSSPAIVIVAAVAILGAAIGWVVIVRDDQARPFTLLEPATTRPTASSDAPIAPDWYAMTVADLVPGAVTHETCCPSGELPGPSTVMAWAAKTGLPDGILLLLAEPTGSGPDVLKFMSLGLTDARTSQLKDEVVAGSGLPYVLPDPAMEVVGVGLDGFGNRTAQTYVGRAGTVTISVGDYRGQLTPIVLGAGLHPVQIAGSTAYRYTDFNGIHVVWRTHAGHWAQLDIDQGLADHESEIIGAITGAIVPASG